MPPDLLDRLQADKLQGLEALLDSYNSAIAASGGADIAAAVADFFVDEGIGVRQNSRRLWAHHWAQALAGKIADRPERGTRLFALLERAGYAIRRGAALARAYAALSGQDVARLLQFEEQSRAFSVWVRECRARWDMLDQPRPPIQRERSAESRAAYARGEGETVADIIGRLEQGGPLAKG